MNSPLCNQIHFAICNQDSNVELNQSQTLSEIRDAVRKVMRDNPNIFWFAHQYQFDDASSTMHFQYTFSPERVQTIKQSTNDMIKNDFCVKYLKKLTLQEPVAYRFY